MNMARFSNRLRHVQVAAPCKVSWDEMLGDERVRFCGQCSLNVYNLSSMARADAEALIARTEGRLCVKFYRRFDGSIVTKDCPIGLAAIKRRVSYAWQALGSMTLTFLAGFGIHQAFSRIPSFVHERTVGVMARTELPPSVIETKPGLVEVMGERVEVFPRSSKARRSKQSGQ
jgi:hypothetical protein